MFAMLGLCEIIVLMLPTLGYLHRLNRAFMEAHGLISEVFNYY